MVDLIHTQNRSYFCPDIRIKRLEPHYILVPLRESASNVAVFNSDKKCIGWIHVVDLGFQNVKEWMTAINWKDIGI